MFTLPKSAQELLLNQPSHEIVETLVQTGQSKKSKNKMADGGTLEEIISNTKVSKASHRTNEGLYVCIVKMALTFVKILYTCKFLIFVISVKDHKVTLESGFIVRLRNSKISFLPITKLIGFYPKFALSCGF